MIGFPLDAKHCATPDRILKNELVDACVSAVRLSNANVWGNGLAKGDHGDHADTTSVHGYSLGIGLDYLRAIVCAKPSHGVTIMR